MISDGIGNGNLLMVAQTLTTQHNDIAMVAMEGEFTVNAFFAIGAA